MQSSLPSASSRSVSLGDACQGSYLSIRDGALRLSEPLERHGARLPYDFFLRSLAEELRSAIANNAVESALSIARSPRFSVADSARIRLTSPTTCAPVPGRRGAVPRLFEPNRRGKNRNFIRGRLVMP